MKAVQYINNAGSAVTALGAHSPSLETGKSPRKTLRDIEVYLEFYRMKTHMPSQLIKSTKHNMCIMRPGNWTPSISYIMIIISTIMSLTSCNDDHDDVHDVRDGRAPKTKGHMQLQLQA